MNSTPILEPAQPTVVPTSGAILPNRGADVIRTEYPVRGETQRDFVNTGGIKVNTVSDPYAEHPNRGIPSVGVDINIAGVALAARGRLASPILKLKTPA